MGEMLLALLENDPWKLWRRKCSVVAFLGFRIDHYQRWTCRFIVMFNWLRLRLFHTYIVGMIRVRLIVLVPLYPIYPPAHQPYLRSAKVLIYDEDTAISSDEENVSCSLYPPRHRHISITHEKKPTQKSKKKRWREFRGIYLPNSGEG